MYITGAPEERFPSFNLLHSMNAEEFVHLAKANCNHPISIFTNTRSVRAISNLAQLSMAVYSASAEFISPPVIIGCGIVAFVASMLEVILDLRFPPHDVRNQ
jgi:hypothetical protein